MSSQAILLKLIVVAVCASAPPAFAEGHWGGSMGGTSDYIAYGLSQTRGGAALQADLHYRFGLNGGASGYFAGAWASTLNEGPQGDSRFELDVYAGGMWRIGPQTSATLTFMHYGYPGSSNLPRYDYDELAATWSYADRLSATVAWSPDTLNYWRAATARCCRRLSYEIQGRQPLKLGLTVSAGAGFADLTDLPGYGFWNAGLARMLGPVQVDVSYFGTDRRARRLFSEDVAGARWAASALWRFGGH